MKTFLTITALLTLLFIAMIQIVNEVQSRKAKQELKRAVELHDMYAKRQKDFLGL